MGALAGRLGRHRPRLAGATGLTVALALALPAPALASHALVRWTSDGGLDANPRASLLVRTDRTGHVADGRGVSEVTLGRREFRRLKDRVAATRFATLESHYEPDRPVIDVMTQTVRHHGRSVTVTDGADIPRRLQRLLGILLRIYYRHAPSPETNPR